MGDDMVVYQSFGEIIWEFRARRELQQEKVKKLRDDLQLTYVEMHEKKFSATMRVCRRLDSALRKQTQILEGALLQLEEKHRESPNAIPTPKTLTQIRTFFNDIDRNIAYQVEIPKIVRREGNYQRRMSHALDIMLGNRALLEDMIAHVEKDSVAHATVDLIARLHGVNSVVMQLPVGIRCKELEGYRFALKNIGAFVRAVKNVYKVFCTVYR